MCEICSKVTAKTPEQCYLTEFTDCSGVSIVGFEHVNTRWDISFNKNKGSLKVIPWKHKN